MTSKVVLLVFLFKNCANLFILLDVMFIRDLLYGECTMFSRVGYTEKRQNTRTR